MKLIGPFKQAITLANLPLRGKLSDEQLEIITDGGILINNGKIQQVGNFETLQSENQNIEIEIVEGEQIVLPAFVDSHTHICFGGNRANDLS